MLTELSVDSGGLVRKGVRNVVEAGEQDKQPDLDVGEGLDELCFLPVLVLGSSLLRVWSGTEVLNVGTRELAHLVATDALDGHGALLGGEEPCRGRVVREDEPPDDTESKGDCAGWKRDMMLGKVRQLRRPSRRGGGCTH